MKSQVSPIAAIAIVAVFVIIIGVFAWTRMSGGSASSNGKGESPPGMPPEAAAEFQKRMGTTTPTGTSPGGSNAVPPPGAPSGYISAPSSK